MATVLVDLAISVDGFIAGPGGEDAGLHDWYFAGSPGVDRDIVEELVQAAGAIVMGRRSYDLGMNLGGFEDTPYQVPHFVLTHRPPKHTRGAGPPFTFVDDGVRSLIAQARAAADERYVAIGGGADTVHQCLDAGAVDEIALHVVPKLLGSGLRLFGDSGRPANLKRIGQRTGEGACHLHYRLMT